MIRETEDKRKTQTGSIMLWFLDRWFIEAWVSELVSSLIANSPASQYPI